MENMKGAVWTDEREKELIHLYKTTNLNYKQIGEKLGRSKKAIEQRIHILIDSGKLK